MDTALDRWIRMRSELDRLHARSKDIHGKLKKLEEKIVEMQYIDEDEKITRDGYEFKIVTKKVSGKRLTKQEKLIVMSEALADIIKNPQKNREEDVKTLLESALPEKFDVAKFKARKIKKKEE